MNTIKIGSRGSKLALAQTNYIINLFRKKHLDINVKLIIIKTTGDTDRISSLEKIGGTGVFTKKIEQALINKTIDIAVHSAKDLPSVDANGLMIGAVPERGPIEDVWIAKDNSSFADTKPGSVVGTSSPRRKAMLLHMRSDLIVRDIRGNIETRLSKLSLSGYDALIAARAGLYRLGFDDETTEILSPDIFIPAPGQGALAVQIRCDDKNIKEIVSLLNDEQAHRCLNIERLLLKKLNAGCSTAIGGIAYCDINEVWLKAVIFNKNGSKRLDASDKITAELSNELLVDKVMNSLIKQGAIALIDG